MFTYLSNQNIYQYINSTKMNSHIYKEMKYEEIAETEGRSVPSARIELNRRIQPEFNTIKVLTDMPACPKNESSCSNILVRNTYTKEFQYRPDNKITEILIDKYNRKNNYLSKTIEMCRSNIVKMQKGYRSRLYNIKKCRKQIKSNTFKSMKLPELRDQNVSVHRPNKSLIQKYHYLLNRRSSAIYPQRHCRNHEWIAQYRRRMSNITKNYAYINSIARSRKGKKTVQHRKV